MSEWAEASEAGAIGRSVLLAVSSVQDLLVNFFGVGDRWFVEQGGATFPWLGRHVVENRSHRHGDLWCGYLSDSGSRFLFFAGVVWCGVCVSVRCCVLLCVVVCVVLCVVFVLLCVVVEWLHYSKIIIIDKKADLSELFFR